MDDGAAWLGAMEALLRSERFDLVIPCNETTLLPLQRHRAQLESLARLAIPDDHAIAILFDKHATRELARQVGVPVAPGRLARPDDTAEAVLAELGAPVMVKPRRSYALETLSSRGKARVVRDAGTLARILAEVAPEETLLEQFFPGQGLGVSLLASKGRVLQAFEHHRVRELAGASFYRVSAPLTPELARACEAIVAATPYTGVAMFEFKRNESGGWILLEVNARPWGSMPLPLALGVDFPYRWYRLLTAGEETPPVEYRVGVYGRNLVPDLYASRAEAAGLRLGSIATVGSWRGAWWNYCGD
jgi:predicted ATP-grasp superfamily ATP-dependent carboligase